MQPRRSWSTASPGLWPARPYEGQARARNSQGVGPWSSTLLFETNSDLFRNAPPGNLRAENIAQSKTRLGVALDWDLVLDATGYQVRVTSPGNQRSSQQIVEASKNRLALTYELAASDTGGTLIFSVRGKRVAGSETTYTPWAPDVPLFYFVEATVPVSQVLDAELAGSRQVSQGVEDTRQSLNAAVTDVSAISGFEPDTQGILDFLAVLPALIIVGTGAYAGMKFRALGLAMGVSSVIAVMSMFVGTSVLGLDVIWPMLGLFGLVVFGILSIIRKYRIATPVVLYALLFGALHVAAVFSQNVAGFSLSGAADYGGSIWAGTPVDDLLAVRKLDFLLRPAPAVHGAGRYLLRAVPAGCVRLRGLPGAHRRGGVVCRPDQAGAQPVHLGPHHHHHPPALPDRHLQLHRRAGHGGRRRGRRRRDRFFGRRRRRNSPGIHRRRPAGRQGQ